MTSFGWLNSAVRSFGVALRGLLAAVTLGGLVLALPWALIHYIGRPLPDHAPTWPDLEGFLLAPMSTTFLVDFLACACWTVWFIFVLDVLRAGAGIARSRSWPDLSNAGPVRWLACVLVGAVLLMVLGTRAVATSTTPTARSSALPQVATVSYLVPSNPLPPTSVVLPQENGIYDSLWRIAQRTLGDGNRWPEIFQLNEGTPQPDGRLFTDPDLVYPGQVLALPGDSSASREPAPSAAPEPVPPKATTSPAAPPTTSASSPARAGASAEPQPEQGPGIDVGPELLVSLGLAAAVSAALAIARRRHRARYRAGSGDRRDLPVAPSVYRLQLAHLRADQDDRATPDEGLAPGPAVGIRDGRELGLDLAATGGLGLVGPGSSAAARALLVTAAASAVRVVAPKAELGDLLGHDPVHGGLPARIQALGDLEQALDVLEAEMLVRAAERPDDFGPRLLLVATVPVRHQRRLQALLDRGSTLGITGVLLGQWQPGATAYVRADGTVSATSPGTAEQLRGSRMFHMNDESAAALLELLCDAEAAHPADALDSAFTEQEAQLAADGLEIVDVGPALPTDPVVIEPDAPTPRPTESAPTPPMRIDVLGAPRVFWRRCDFGATLDHEVTSQFQPRTRELLVFLAMHPAGATREALVAALWPEVPNEKSTNALNTALSRLRRAVGTATGNVLQDILLAGDGRFQLDPALVEVDFWQFDGAVTARRSASTDQQRTTANRAIADAYRGPLADGMSTEWIETAREGVRRDAIDAVAALARALIAEDPQQTLELLEMARAFDPHNEALYRDIMRLQGRLGQFDAIPRTLALLTSRLAEIDDQPSEVAIRLADGLQHRSETSEGTTLKQI